MEYITLVVPAPATDSVLTNGVIICKYFAGRDVKETAVDNLVYHLEIFGGGQR
jgi:hypothetical protein